MFMNLEHFDQVTKFDASVTPNFPSAPNRVIIGHYVKEYMLAHHFSHYYSRRCWRMVFELASVINPQSQG
jgi:hypothetical protein